MGSLTQRILFSFCLLFVMIIVVVATNVGLESEVAVI